ncbi:hypothetical protein ACWGB8_11345 [Kitasatospora sp. NPDC054939]
MQPGQDGTNDPAQAAGVPRLPLVVWKAAADAAGQVGDRAREEHYRVLAVRERQRIDDELSGAGFPG